MNNTTDIDYHVTVISFAKAFPMILVALAAFLENSLVLVAVARSKALRQLPGNVFIVNLAITDVMGSTLCMPFGIVTVMTQGHYIFGHAGCQFQAFLIVTLSNVTFLTLLGYSIFRYIMITSTTRQLTISTLWKGVKMYLLCIWTLGMVFAALPLVGWGRFSYFASYFSCTVDWTADKSYSTTVFVFVFLIPQTIILVSYYKISKFVRRHKKHLSKCRKISHVEHSMANNDNHGYLHDVSSASPSNAYQLSPQIVFVKSFEGTNPVTLNNEDKSGLHSQSPQQHVTTKGRSAVSLLRIVQQERLVKILLFTVLAFYVCWLPFAVASFQQVIGHGGPRPRFYDVTSMWLAFSNALCNPIIYGLLNGQFRKAFRDTMKSICGCFSSK